MLAAKRKSDKQEADNQWCVSRNIPRLQYFDIHGIDFDHSQDETGESLGHRCFRLFPG